jgi:hypothetical protein
MNLQVRSSEVDQTRNASRYYEHQSLHSAQARLELRLTAQEATLQYEYFRICSFKQVRHEQ